MGKNIGKYINKNLSGKYIQKLFNHTKQSPTDTLKTVSGLKTPLSKAPLIVPLFL